VTAICRIAVKWFAYVIRNYKPNIVVDGACNCRPVLDYEMYNNNNIYEAIDSIHRIMYICVLIYISSYELSSNNMIYIIYLNIITGPRWHAKRFCGHAKMFTIIYYRL